MTPGAFLISFDFELAWGMRASDDEAGRFDGIERVREVVPALLEIFAEFDVPATWATVGHLMLTEAQCPGGRFTYDMPAPDHAWYAGDWFGGIPGLRDNRANQFYAADLVEAILTCPAYQELACHTFSHVNIGDEGCTEDVARAEFQTCQNIARHWGRELKSVVFPRNRIGHLPVLRETGFTSYRAENSEWYWFGRPTTFGRSRLLSAAAAPLRYLDECLPMTPPLPLARRNQGLWELPHSMFFPGFSGVSKWISAERRAHRAQLGLRAAAERGRIFSLYTHPHNFLPNPQPLLEAFRAICREAAELRDQGRLSILTMDQITEELNCGRNLHWAECPADDLEAAQTPSPHLRGPLRRREQQREAHARVG